MPLDVDDLTLPQLVERMAGLNDDNLAFNEAVGAWSAGLRGGGPFGDGRYPLPRIGDPASVLIPSPDRLAELAEEGKYLHDINKFRVVGDAINNYDAAFARALANNESVYLGNRTVNIEAPINWAAPGKMLVGAGPNLSKIVQQTSGQPILMVSNSRQGYADLTLTWGVDQTGDNVGADGFRGNGTADWWRSHIRNVHIVGCYTGLHMPPGRQFFSNTVDNLTVERFARSGLWLENGSGGTGNMLNNVYITNVGRIAVPVLGSPVDLWGLNDGAWGQLNVEHYTGPFSPVRWQECFLQKVLSLHVEDWWVQGDNRSVLNIQDLAAVDIDVLTFSDSKIYNANGALNFWLANLYANAHLRIGELHELRNDLTGATFGRIRSTGPLTGSSSRGGETAAYDAIASVERVWSPKIVDLVAQETPSGPARKPVLRQWDGRTYYRENGVAGERSGTAPPTTGTYPIGEYVRNANPEPGAPIGWHCVVAGTPGTWRALFPQRWTPDIIRDRIGAWLSAKDRASVVLDQATGKVQEWVDRASGFPLAASGASGRAVLNKTGWDGYGPTIDFDGALNGSVLRGVGPTASEYTIFMTAKRGDQQLVDAGGAARPLVLIVQGNNVREAGVILRSAAGDPGQQLVYGSELQSGVTSSRVGWGPGVNAMVSVSVTAAGAITTRLNAGDPATASNAAFPGMAGNVYQVGGWDSTYPWARGAFRCRQILVVLGVLTDTVRQRIEGWLAWEDGLQGQLPANHPYVNDRP